MWKIVGGSWPPALSTTCIYKLTKYWLNLTMGVFKGQSIEIFPTVFPTHPLRSLGFGALGKNNGDYFVCRYIDLTF